MIREYRTIEKIECPLVTVRQVAGVSVGELAEIVPQGGKPRRGVVLEVSGDTALVQLFDCAAGLDIKATCVRFLGHGARIAVSEDMPGRVFDGLGAPIDGGPEILAEAYRDISGQAQNPTVRESAGEPVQTGIVGIDGLETLRLGERVALLSGAGLPHLEIVFKIARQARDDGAAVVFAAVGASFEETEAFIQEARRVGTIDRTVVFASAAGDAAGKIMSTPRAAITTAEYLAFEKDMSVLVVLLGMENYADALREICAARKALSGRGGYPANMNAEISGLFERAGRRAGKAGSVTLLSVASMPEDDVFHPVSEALGDAADRRIVLPRETHADVANVLEKYYVNTSEDA